VTAITPVDAVSLYRVKPIIGVGTPFLIVAVTSPDARQWSGEMYLLLVALLPAFADRRWVSWTTFIVPMLAFGVAIDLLWAGHFGSESDKTNVMMLLLMCFAGSVADIVWLWLNRFIGRLICRSPTLGWTFAWLVISTGSVALMALVSTVNSINKDTLSFLPFYIKLIGIVVLLTRFFSGFVSLVLLLLLLMLLIHRLTWPLLSRFVYPLQRFKIFGYRKFMAGIGICLMLGLPLKDLILHQLDLKEASGKIER
jgi:flagellar biosynthesis protein FliQ